MDARGNFCVLTVLNIQVGVIQVGNSVVASSPVLVHLGPEKQPIVRVDDPYQIEVNNKRIIAAQMAWVEMRVDAKS